MIDKIIGIKMVVKTAFGQTGCNFEFKIEDVEEAKKILGHHVDALVSKAESSHTHFDSVATARVNHLRWKNEKTSKELNSKIGEAVRAGCDITRDGLDDITRTKFALTENL